MSDMPKGRTQAVEPTRLPPVEAIPTETTIESRNRNDGRDGDRADRQEEKKSDTPPDHPPGDGAQPPPKPPRRRRWLKWLLIIGVILGLAVGLYFLIPWVVTMMTTISTDDAYIHGHVTMVAPRVSGQVSRVLVEDNNQVKKGDILVQLDKVPFQVQVKIRQAAVVTAEADLYAAGAQVRGLLALARSQRWHVQNAMEQVATQVATLKANVAVYQSKLATLELAKSNLRRAEQLVASGGVSKEEVDVRRQAVKVDQADVEQALQTVHANRVGLGLPPGGSDPKELAEAPPNIEQSFSTVRTSLATLLQTTSQIGLPLPSTESTPQSFLEQFRKQDASGDIDRIVENLIPKSPQVKQAEGKLEQARRDLEQAQLNLKYCDVVSEIDGVVTRRNVNPGNNVQVGQSLMAVRSLSEIWVDANFKETQLGDLRIGQRVRCVVDMYGKQREFEGRITGFTMGTGQTLSLLPPENATGNFVKVVQRLPVRIDFVNYDPSRDPLFVGLSVVPYVYYQEAATGPHAGEVLQPKMQLPQAPPEPKP
jgi:membrane fusion protein (multidrug efflux system)